MASIALATAMAPATTVAQHEHEEARPALTGGYAPRLGELMILQQIRHSKLWFAVAANNWELAEHGLYELKAGFPAVTRRYPHAYGVTFAPVAAPVKAGGLPQLAQAILAQGGVRLTIAFDQLTAACNACHQVTNHAFIVIQQPISPPFNNQSFGPPGGQPPPPGGGGHPH